LLEISGVSVWDSFPVCEIDVIVSGHERGQPLDVLTFIEETVVLNPG